MGDGERIMSDHLAEALQEAWNEWCQDTGHVPDGFRIHGPRSTRVDFDHRKGMQFVRNVTSALGRAGYRIVKDDPNHYVCFTADSWFIEHALECRIAGTIGTCVFNHAILDLADELPAPPDDLLGRWLITGINGDGTPQLERAS